MRKDFFYFIVLLRYYGSLYSLLVLPTHTFLGLPSRVTDGWVTARVPSEFTLLYHSLPVLSISQS